MVLNGKKVLVKVKKKNESIKDKKLSLGLHSDQKKLML